MQQGRRPYRQQRKSGFARLLDYLVSGAVLIALAVVAAALSNMSGGVFSGNPAVVDGDSLAFGETRVRLEGIDAPEFTQTCEIGGKPAQCGQLARAHLRSLIAGRKVECDSFAIDKYDRPLVRCRAGLTDLNAAMVRDGWAVAFGDHEREESEARNAGRGLWQGEFAEPKDWRREHQGEAVDLSPHIESLRGLIARAGKAIVDFIRFW